MMPLRALGLRVMFVVGALLALVVAIFIFIRSLRRGLRAFHPHGSVCVAEVTAIDDVIGKRLVGPARLRFASSTAVENSPDQSIIGCGMKLGTDQDLAFATFESFVKMTEGSANTNVADYMANQYPSATPWRVDGLGVMWLRLVPDPAVGVPKTGLRTERLDADIAAGRAVFVLEARDRPNADGPVHARLATVKLVERLPADDPAFRISMFRNGRGIHPTGFRNGLRCVLYPVSQLGRRLRGG